MIAAMEAVQKGSMSTKKAALLHGVPRSTLQDRLTGRVMHGRNPGPKPYLSPTEERALADHLVEAADVGYGKSRTQVKAIVGEIAAEKKVLRSQRVSDGWWRRFKERQPQLALRRGDATAHVRMDSTNKEAIKQYYDLLEDTLQEHHLSNNAAQIYNMDESGMPLDHRPPNVIARRGQKKVRYRVAGKKEQITVIGCVNAIGQSIPPMVIFEGKYLNHQWTAGEVPGTFYGMSDKGWTDQELFSHWLKDHFLRYAVPGRPLLLLLDGHSSHYEPASIELAREEGVILFCLPPHTTQDSQPLDCTVFGPLKRHWSNACHDFQQRNPGMMITKFNFSRVFSEAWLKALTPGNIVVGFKKCGIHPFNRDAIPVPHKSSPGNVTPSKPAPVDDGDTPAPCTVNTLNAPTPAFTCEQIAVYEKRYQEGYDIYDDQHYVAWLHIHHPEAVLCDQSTPPDRPTSLLQEFFNVAPLVPLNADSPPNDSSALHLAITSPPIGTSMPPSSSSPTATVSHSISPPGTTESAVISSYSPQAASAIVSPSISSPPDATISPCNLAVGSLSCTNTTASPDEPTHSNASTPGTSITLISSSNGSVASTPLQKYLHLPTTAKTKKTPVASSETRAITGARVLTSAECLAIIKEKEMKKKQENEEKEKRKRQREEKKRQREEEKRQREEEKRQ